MTAPEIGYCLVEYDLTDILLDEHWEYFDYVDEDIDEPLQDGHVEVLWNDSLKLSQVPILLILFRC